MCKLIFVIYIIGNCQTNSITASSHVQENTYKIHYLDSVQNNIPLYNKIALGKY